MIELEDDIEVTFDNYYITEGSEVWLPSETGLELISNVVQPLYSATDVVHYYGSEEQLVALIGDTTLRAAYLLPLLALGGGGSSDSDDGSNNPPSTGNKLGPNSSTGNAPPVVDILGEHIDINVGASSWTEDVTSHFSDSDGTIESYRATLDNGQPLPSWLLFDPTTGLFRGTPLIGDVGDLSVRVYATDNKGVETSSSSWLTITMTL